MTDQQPPLAPELAVEHHYAQAVKWLAGVRHYGDPATPGVIAIAQVHATLAHACATIRLAGRSTSPVDP